MRLLVVSQYFWPEDFRINDLVKELIRRGHDVTVLTGKPNYPVGAFFPQFLEQPQKFSTYEGARVIRVPMLPRGKGAVRLSFNYLSYAASATFFGITWLRKERFDAMFVFEPSPVTVGLPAVALRRLRGWPIAFWVLDQWPETLSAVGAVTSKTALWAIGLLVSFIYARCDLILAPSKSLVTRIQDVWKTKGRVVYFPNWVESAYAAAAAEAAPEVPVREGSFNIMFAGNVGESQGFAGILDAAEQLAGCRHIRWLIVGDGRVAGWVKAEVNRRGLENVVLLGRHPPERMASFYKHADALLVSLRSDPIFSMTTPGKIQSYLAFGLPILAMLDGDGARVIEEAQAGLTCPAGDSSKLAEIAQRMAAMSHGDRAFMGANGRAYAQREYDRDALVTRLEEFLTGLLRAPAESVGQ